jgi:cytochrome c oxidase assembly factor 6
MFGFGSSSTASSSSASSSDVPGAAPNREERAQCWTHRDAYFTCLDKNGIITAGDDKGPCQSEKKGYEGSCSRSWVGICFVTRNHRSTEADTWADRLFQQEEGVGDETESDGGSGGQG